MLTSKSLTLNPILESRDGLHLTIYLNNNSDFNYLKLQLEASIRDCKATLSPIMLSEELEEFLKPIYSLISDSKILNQFKNNIGVFRTSKTFRVLNIPVATDFMCSLADTFHVKPLLKWIQTDKEYLLLGIQNENVELYFGSQNTFKLVDKLNLPRTTQASENWFDKWILQSSESLNHENKNAMIINEWIANYTKFVKPKMFVAGEKRVVQNLIPKLSYKDLIKKPILDFYNEEYSKSICNLIRMVMEEESNNLIKKALYEVYEAEESNRVQKNLTQISKAVVQGKVKKIIVAEEYYVYGKINKTTGELELHPYDLDHEDDDVLDDLAQMVLHQGGEVLLASKYEIPKGRPILAILKERGDEKLQSKHKRISELTWAKEA